MIELILWDIDGTLVRASGLGRESTRLSMETVFGTSAGLADHQFGGKTDWYTLVELLAAVGISETTVIDRLPEYTNVIGENMARIAPNYDVRPCVGAPELLSTLRDRVPFGIVTGNVQTTAPVKLRAADYDPAWFIAGAYGNESADRNDLPIRAIQRASDVLDRPINAASVLVVGDTPADIACARATGAQVCAVATGWSSKETLAAANPDYLLNDLTEFRATVDLGL